MKRIMENGIPVNDNTMVEVLDLCNYLGMDLALTSATIVLPSRRTFSRATIKKHNWEPANRRFPMTNVWEDSL